MKTLTTNLSTDLFNLYSLRIKTSNNINQLIENYHEYYNLSYGIRTKQHRYIIDNLFCSCLNELCERYNVDIDTLDY